MKKFTVMALAAIMVIGLTIPSWSMETQFGGYWRTRAYTMQNFSGEDQTEAMDGSLVDTRTRLYFTTIFNENLKFVNKFEFDTTWGDITTGDIGADGKGQFEIKNSYADFNLGAVNAKVGIQGYVLARGFMFDDDFSGAVINYKGNGIEIPVIYMKAYEGDNDDKGNVIVTGADEDENDVSYLAINPSFMAGNMTLNPFAMYVFTGDNANEWGKIKFADTADEVDIFYAGLNFDMDMDAFSLWATGIYQFGEITYDTPGMEDRDISAYLAAVGASVNMGMGDIHGQFFYASGQDADEEDAQAFFVPKGQSYYWAEIMGYGTFDYDVSNGSCADQISNIMAANIGVTLNPNDRMSISLDAWYAALAEEDARGEDYLGTEIDLAISYKLVEGLTLDVIGAYLFAGEATTLDSADEADPYEIGTQLSLKF